MTEAEYRAWNAQLAERFLQANSSERPVYLYTDTAVLEEVSPALGVPEQDAKAAFCSAVASTLGAGSDPFRPWVVAAGRTVDNGERPDYVAALCFLVLAAVERDSVNFQYYPALNRMLGRPVDDGAPPGFDRAVRAVFEAFNGWLTANSRFGRPTARPSSHYAHVGWPLSQAVVRPSDRRVMQELFGSLGLQPGKGAARPMLRHQVVARLRTGGSTPSRDRLLTLNERDPDLLDDVLGRELDSWTGRPVVVGPSSVRLRLCFAEPNEWWLTAPMVDGTQNMPFTVGSARGTTPAFKGLEVEPPDLWDLVGAGRVGRVADGPVLVSPARSRRWLSIDVRVGGWAEVNERDPGVDQLVVVRSSERAEIEHAGCAPRSRISGDLWLFDVPAGLEIGDGAAPTTLVSAPYLDGGLPLSSSSFTYLSSDRFLPSVVDARSVQVDGSPVNVAGGRARLTGADGQPGVREIVADGTTLRLRFVDKVREAWTSGEDWVDLLPQVASVIVPHGQGAVWALGDDGRAVRWDVRTPAWLDDVGLFSTAVDVTGRLTLLDFEPRFVVSHHMGRPWVVTVTGFSGGGEPSAPPQRTDVRRLVTELLAHAAPEPVVMTKVWKRVLASLLRSVG